MITEYQDSKGKSYLSSSLCMKFTFSGRDLESEDTGSFYESHSGEEVSILDENGNPVSKLDTNLLYVPVEFPDGSRGYAHPEELSLITL